MSVPAPDWPLRMDDTAALRGLGLEDLSWLSRAQPWHSAGPVLHRDALGLLLKALDAPVGRPAEPVRAQQIERLLRAELLDGTGGLTDAGRVMAETVQQAAARVQVEATTGGRAYACEAVLGDSTTVLLASASPTVPQAGQGADEISLDLVELEWAAPAIASWLGLGPAWTFGPAEPLVLDERVLHSRVADSSLPLPDAWAGPDDLPAALWAQPWVLWGARASRGIEPLLLLSAGARGQWSVIREGEDAVLLEPVPTAAVWAALLALVESAYLDRSGGAG